jgi:cytoskeletal protein CcmA (bactofilin family)
LGRKMEGVKWPIRLTTSASLCAQTPRAPEPSKITEGVRSGAEPNSAMPLPATPNFLRAGAQPGQAPFLPRPKTDQSVAIRDNVVEPRKLIVGQGTFLSGEINSCDRIVVEGNVQANLQNCQRMDITETGVFNGNAAIDDVEVSGRFEGDLVVRKRLMIRASGQVSGTITYGEIEIEAGGRISGVIQAPEGPKGLRTLAASLLHGTPD